MKMKLLRSKNWKVFFISLALVWLQTGLSLRAADPCRGDVAGFG